MAEKLLRMEAEKLGSLLKEECLQSSSGINRLVDVTNNLLRLQTAIKDVQLKVIEQLIAGDTTFEEFSKKTKKYDDSSACGLVWTADFVAYRCRTCGISPCMSICADCFHGGDHTDHDFNMFRSLAGGACDCGDTSVMKSTGFCSDHSLGKPHAASSVPKHLTITAEVVIPRLVWRLLLHFRTNYASPIMVKFDPMVIADVCPLLELFDRLSKLGGVLRRVIVTALLDESIYTELMQVTKLDETLQREGCLAYRAAMSSLTYPDLSTLKLPVPSYPALDPYLEHHNFVGELLFWTTVYNFPQEMITFLLSMLPDNSYKEKFTTIFLKHYVRIAMTLKGRTNPNHVVHISVQLFSNETLASKMVTEMGLLHVLCLSGLILLKPALQASPLMASWPDRDSRKSVHQVLNCDSKILKDQCYWPIVSDFSNIMSHQSVASYFFKDHLLMQLWSRFLTLFMGMNLNKRELSFHIEFEPNSYSTAFAAEIEGCAAPMWQIASHCQNKTAMLYTIAFTKELQAALILWLENLNMGESLHPLQISFHIPLIRYLSVFLKQGVNEQGMSLSLLLRSPGRLKQLMLFPLQIMAAVSEVFCGMWVRNGLQMRCQAMTYLQCHFCASMADLDLYFIQVCAAMLEPTGFSADEFIKIVFQRFKVWNWTTFDPDYEPCNLDTTQEMAMVEAALNFIATLVSIRTNLGMSADESLRLEMVTLLCMEDRTYSKLQDKIPEKTGVISTNCEFEKTLKEIADYQLPTSDLGGLQQGKYSPKSEIWEKEFDPLHVMFRSMERKEFQSAMNNYTTYLNKSGKYKDKKLPWPPFQPLKSIHKEYQPLRKILNCRALHGFLYSLLYKAVHGSNMSETAIYMTVALINMALQCVPDEEYTGPARDEPVTNVEPEKWFTHSSILNNLATEIKAVRYQLNARKENPFEKEMDIKFHAPPSGDTNQFLVSLMMDGEWVEILNTQATGEANADPDDEWVNILTNMIETAEAGATAVPMEVEDTASGEDRAPDLLNLDDQKKDSDGLGNAKRQRKETPPAEFVTKPLNESMISLLVKLYSKLSNREVAYLSPDLREVKSTPKEVLHGQGPDHIKNILDKVHDASPLCREILQINSTCGDEMKSCEGSPEARENRKRRSMEAKQRMIAKLAQQQRQFLENAFSGGMKGLIAADGAIDPAKILPEYECVICSQVEPSSEENPYGLCVLLQSTKVLGHRSQSANPETLPLGEEETLRSSKKKCYQIEAIRWADATARFDKASCLSSFAANWEAGIHIQTCGHYVHIKCLKSFTESIGAHDLQARHLQINAGEYECPICRQLANTILPCSFPRQPTSMAKYTCSDLSKLTVQISKRLGGASRQLNLGKNEFEMGVFKFIDDVLRQLTIELRKAARADVGGSFAYFCSLARTNIELYLVKQGGTLFGTKPDKAADRESFLGQLLEIFSSYLDKVPKITLHNTWQRVTGQYKPSKSELEGGVPVLVRDPITLLFLMVFHLPQPITNDHLQCIVLALFNLVHVQALTRIACRLSASDRHSYLRPTENTRQSEVTVLLGHIIQHLTHLRHSWLYGETPGCDEVCVTIQTPFAIEAYLQEECLPFLRVAAILQNVMFDVRLPEIESPEVEFSSLLGYLHLSSPSAELQTERFSMHSSQSLQISQGNPLALVRSWCEEFNQFLLKCYAAEKSIRVPKGLLLFSPVFHLPRLIRLPEDYSRLFEYYRRQVCQKCNTRPQKPMLCLVCGTLICWASDCCVVFKYSRKFGEGIAHAKECGSLAAVYLDIDSSLTVIIQGNRLCRWASLYLDSHGEEDRGLRRGKPLYLCQQRFDLLEKLWQSVKLKHFCKGWEWHHGGHK